MDKKVVDIGKLEGKILLFGGVYSNLQALEKLISIAKNQGIKPENCICTGDIVGYCAQPEETIQLLKNWGALAIAGNVEKQLSEGSQNCGCDFKKGSRCDEFSQQWYPYAQSKLSQNSLDFISALPDHIVFHVAGKKATVVHGDYDNISKFIFKSTPWKVKGFNFSSTESNIIIAGHCGLPFASKKGEQLWLNPGVIGMPANDGTPKVWFAVLQETKGTIDYTHHSFEYHHTLTSELMKNEGLPEAYAHTINTGIWDNMEILPTVERSLQGQKITF